MENKTWHRFAQILFDSSPPARETTSTQSESTPLAASRITNTSTIYQTQSSPEHQGMEQTKNAKEATVPTEPPKTDAPTPQKQSNKKPATAPPKPKNLPQFNVILLNDDDHTYEYVIEMLGKIFAYPSERGYRLAKEVDATGRVIVRTTHKELAELKRDQIQAYGCDPRLSRSEGSMSATIEPVS